MDQDNSSNRAYANMTKSVSDPGPMGNQQPCDTNPWTALPLPGLPDGYSDCANPTVDSGTYSADMMLALFLGVAS
jgi:hypothetical protein